MLATYISSFFLILMSIKIVKNYNEGIIYYLVLSLIMPNFRIGTTIVSYEIIGFMVIFLFTALTCPKYLSIPKKGILKYFISLFFFIFILASLLAVIRYNLPVPIIPMFSIFRMMIVLLILYKVMKGNENQVLDKIISPVLLVNLITSIIQLMVPQSTQLFYDFYYKESLTPLAEMVNLGYFNRAYGTFGTPVILGSFSLISFTVYFGFYIEKIKTNYLKMKLALSVMLGLLGVSKTFLIGLPAIIIIAYLLIVFRIIKVKSKKIHILPFITSLLTIFVVQAMEKNGIYIERYFYYVWNPLEALASRYGQNEGILSVSTKTIKDNWFLGVGGNTIPGDFLGDSLYFSILYSAGIIGLFIFFIPLIIQTVKSLKYRNTTSLLLFFSFALIGLAAPIQFDMVSIFILAYIFVLPNKFILRKTL